MGASTNTEFSTSSPAKGRGAGGHRWWFAVATLLCLAESTLAQLIGTDICGCQPATYTFTFDFNLTCDDKDVAGPGINKTDCKTEIRGQEEVPDAELVPVIVQNVQIFELDQNLQVSAQTVRVGTFDDGSNFTYTSVISTMPDQLNPASLPRGLQLVITGLNDKAEVTVQNYIITYTNDCGVFPVLTEGETVGWTILVSVCEWTVLTSFCLLLTRLIISIGVHRVTWEIRPPRSVPWLLRWHLQPALGLVHPTFHPRKCRRFHQIQPAHRHCPP
jgi:hypothetical protein